MKWSPVDPLKNETYTVDFIIGMLLSLLGSLLHVGMAIGIVVFSSWLLQKYTDFSPFQASIVCVGVCGLVALNAIHNKLGLLASALHLNPDEEEEEEPDVPSTLSSSQGKVIPIRSKQTPLPLNHPDKKR